MHQGACQGLEGILLHVMSSCTKKQTSTFCRPCKRRPAVVGGGAVLPAFAVSVNKHVGAAVCPSGTGYLRQQQVKTFECDLAAQYR